MGKGIFQKRRQAYWTSVQEKKSVLERNQIRPCHGAESHLAISSGAGLRAGWEPYLRLLGSKSSSGSLAPMDTIFGFGSGSTALAPWEPFHYINPPNFFCVYISRFRQFQEIDFSQKFSKSMRWQRSTGTFCFSTTNVRLSEPELEMGAESRKFGSDRAGTGSRLSKRLRL